jgi:hypothetical protein
MEDFATKRKAVIEEILTIFEEKWEKALVRNTALSFVRVREDHTIAESVIDGKFLLLLLLFTCLKEGIF